MNLNDLSDEQLLALRQQMAGAPRGNAVLNSPVGGFIRGLRDPIDAGAQMLVRSLPDSVVHTGDAVGNAMADIGLPVTRTNHAQGRTVDDVNMVAEKDYRDNWRQGQMDGLDTGRLAGNVVGSAAMLRGLPMGAPTLAGRMGQGALAGAAGGAMTPVEGSPEDFWSAKAQQAGAGALFGAAGVPVVEGAGKVVGNVARRLRPAPAAGAASASADDLLRQAGVDVTHNTPELAGLRAEVEKALASGADIDPAALSRIADARSIGVSLTKGQATREPRQFTTEQDLRNLPGGERLQQRFAEQNQQLLGAINNAGPGGSAYQSGSRVVDALKQYDTTARKGIGEAYDQARGMVGRSVDVPPQPLAQRFGEALETFGEENLPGVIRKRLQSYGLAEGTQTRVFNVEEADKLRKIINANYDPTNRTQAAALNVLRRGIDEAEDQLAGAGSRIGEEAAAAFTKARGLAKSHYQTVEKIDALRAAVEGAEPDKFIRQHVIGAPVGQVKLLQAFLQKASPGLNDELKGQVVSYLKRGAVGDAADEYAKVSASGLRKAMSEIGDDKLRALFSGQELAKLKALSRTASAVQAQPAASAVNNSNSGQAVINALGRMSQIPYLGAVARPLQTAARESRTTASLTPSFQAAPVQTPEELRRALERAGLFAGVGGGLLGAATVQPR